MESTIDKAGTGEPSMTLLNAIYTRRATRSFSTERVESKLVAKLLEAAIQAPSAMNAQPWAFAVIQNPQVLHEISESAKVFLSQNIHLSQESEHFEKLFLDPKFDIFYGATTLVVICAKKNGFGPAEDCYLAGENLMLTATALGLATCPIGFARDVLNTKEFRDKLSIAEDFAPVLPIIIGYSKVFSPKPERRAPVILKWLN